jgi:transcription initiation factor TFIIB
MEMGITAMDERARCPECNGTHLTRAYDRGELVCENCGLVLDENLIDQGQEWRAFDSEQMKKRARTGSPMTYTIHDKGLSTEIGWKNKDAYGKSIPYKNRLQFYRLRRLQRRTRISNAAERNLVTALGELDRITSAMDLPRYVREMAAMIYRKAMNKNMIKGRSIEDFVAATVYLACRQSGIPRTFDEIASFSGGRKKYIGRAYRVIVRGLELKIPPPCPEDYISRFCNKLGLNSKVQAKVAEILRDASDKDLTSGKGPVGITAAAIYVAAIICNKNRTQKEIAEVTGVTEVTIRHRYRELIVKLGIEIQP